MSIANLLLNNKPLFQKILSSPVYSPIDKAKIIAIIKKMEIVVHDKEISANLIEDLITNGDFKTLAETLKIKDSTNETVINLLFERLVPNIINKSKSLDNTFLEGTVPVLLNPLVEAASNIANKKKGKLDNTEKVFNILELITRDLRKRDDLFQKLKINNFNFYEFTHKVYEVYASHRDEVKDSTIHHYSVASFLRTLNNLFNLLPEEQQEPFPGMIEMLKTIYQEKVVNYPPPRDHGVIDAMRNLCNTVKVNYYKRNKSL